MQPKDLSYIIEQYEEVTAPIMKLIESKSERIATTSAAAMPYVLQEIQTLSDVLVGVEAIIGQLMEDYNRMTTAYVYTRRQVETCRDALHEYIHHETMQTNWDLDKYVERIKKQEQCQATTNEY